MFFGSTVQQSELMEKLQPSAPEQKLDLSKWHGRKVCQAMIGREIVLSYYLPFVTIMNIGMSFLGALVAAAASYPLSLANRTWMVMIPGVLSPLNPLCAIIAIFNAFAASLASQPLPLSIRIGMIALPAILTCASYYMNLSLLRSAYNREILQDIVGEESLDIIGKEPFDSLKKVDIDMPNCGGYSSMLLTLPYDTCLSKNIFLLNAHVETRNHSRTKREFLVIPYTIEQGSRYDFYAMAIEIGYFKSGGDSAFIGNGQNTHHIYLSILDKLSVEQAQILKILIATGKCDYDPLNLSNGKVTLGNLPKASS